MPRGPSLIPANDRSSTICHGDNSPTQLGEYNEIWGSYSCGAEHLRTGKQPSTNFTIMLPCIVIDFLLNNQTDALIIHILFCYKTLHVSGNLSTHHQEFSTVHSALVSFMQVFVDRFQVESGSWLCLETAIKNLHETYQCRMYGRKFLVMGREVARNM